MCSYKREATKHPKSLFQLFSDYIKSGAIKQFYYCIDIVSIADIKNI